MATTRPGVAQLGRLCLASTSRSTLKYHREFFQPFVQVRQASASSKNSGSRGQNPQKNKKKGDTAKKKKKLRTTYMQYDVRDAEQFSLLDAMRYLRAFEVGQSPTSVKYELALKLKSLKNGPVVRNRLRLPHPVKTDLRICVICSPNSKYAEAATAAGATLVGEDEVFEAVKDGRVEFDRCICQTDSLLKMNKSGVGRFLGPRGLMPSAKTGTVVKDPASAVKELVGGAEYREKMGVIRIAIGQLGFTPEEVQRNIKTLIEATKKDMAQLSDKINKDLAEVVLSSTNGPGFSLSGDFMSAESTVTPRELSTC